MSLESKPEIKKPELKIRPEKVSFLKTVKAAQIPAPADIKRKPGRPPAPLPTASGSSGAPPDPTKPVIVLNPPAKENVDNIASMTKAVANMIFRTDKAPELAVSDEEARAFAYPAAQLLDYYMHLANPLYLVWANALGQFAIIAGKRMMIIKERSKDGAKKDQAGDRPAGNGKVDNSAPVDQGQQPAAGV